MSLLFAEMNTPEERSRVYCSKCKIRFAQPGLKKCNHCRELENNYAKKSYETKDKLGVCTVCGNPRDVKGQKKCSKCSEIAKERLKELREFRYSNNLCVHCGKSALPDSTLCQEHLDKCREQTARRRIKAWQSIILATIKHNTKRFNYETSDITKEYLDQMLADQNGKCYWTDVPMITTDIPRHPQKITPDRLDCSRGYLKGNVVLACYSANVGRSNTTVELFEEFQRTQRKIHTVDFRDRLVKELLSKIPDPALLQGILHILDRVYQETRQTD